MQSLGQSVILGMPEMHIMQEPLESEKSALSGWHQSQHSTASLQRDITRPVFNSDSCTLSKACWCRAQTVCRSAGANARWSPLAFSHRPSGGQPELRLARNSVTPSSNCATEMGSIGINVLWLKGSWLLARSLSVTFC